MADNLDPVPSQPYPVASVVVTPNPNTVALSGTVQLTATAKDSKNNTVAGVNFLWESHNPAVATVNQSGLVTAFAGIVPPHHTAGSKVTSKLLGGSTVIYAVVKRGDGSPTGIFGQATVNVSGV